MTDAELTAALLAWYARVARPMPWRGERAPYRIWISEVMLQQTQVETVKPYYARWLARFPTLADLAAAELDDVLAVWQGLGYYRRARSLHQAAQLVMADHGGRLPETAEGLRALPGIGDYTAGAIASLAWGLPEPAIDGNVIRVVTRLAAIGGDPARTATRHRIRERVLALLPPAQVADFNQALMQLGGTICTPRPNCAECPWRDGCLAHAQGDETRYPEKVRPAAPRDRLHLAAVIEQSAGWLFGQRPPHGRWGGLWELPRVELSPTDEPRASLQSGLRTLLAAEAEVEVPLATIHHAVSGERIELQAWRVRLRTPPRPAGYDTLRWTTSPGELPMGAAQRQLCEALDLIPR